jgi:hypothetical protein
MTNTTLRTAYFLDVDNLCGSPLPTYQQVQECLSVFDLHYAPNENDLFFFAATAKAAFSVKQLRPGCHVQIGRGKDGSDLRLLEVADPEWLKTRVDRVVIGSGDGIFEPLAVKLAKTGIRVEVAVGNGTLSQKFLKSAAQFGDANIMGISTMNFAKAA